MEYKIEKSTGNMLFLKYDKSDGIPLNTLDMSMWETGSTKSINRNLMDSWESLCKKIEMKMGSFRKILITRVNIQFMKYLKYINDFSLLEKIESDKIEKVDDIDIDDISLDHDYDNSKKVIKIDNWTKY